MYYTLKRFLKRHKADIKRNIKATIQILYIAITIAMLGIIALIYASNGYTLQGLI